MQCNAPTIINHIMIYHHLGSASYAHVDSAALNIVEGNFCQQ